MNTNKILKIVSGICTGAGFVLGIVGSFVDGKLADSSMKEEVAKAVAEAMKKES